MTWIELDREIEKIVCGNGGGFFGCFVGEITTWIGRMARDPLDEDGRRNEVDVILDGEYSRMGWDESFTQGLTLCAKEYGDWRMGGIGECAG